MNVLSSPARVPAWPSLDIQNRSEGYINPNDRRPRMKLPVFFLNNLPIEAYERFCESESFESSHFLSPLTSFQMNHEDNHKMVQHGHNDVPGMVEPKTYGCKKCDKTFAFEQHLVTHEKSHSEAEMLANMSKQQMTVKPSAPNGVGSGPVAKARPYSCNECGKSFVLKHHLTSHEKTHTGLRPHACEFCGKTFTHKHCLNTHLLLHSSLRPYECTECKKRFTLKHHLISHARVHNREKPFVCVDCGLAFALKRHLVTHSKYHAGKRPFVCEECGESFSQKDQLVMHSRFHGSVNSYVCSECGDSFTRKFELVSHGKIHGKLPHVCEICCKEFLQKRTLISHMKEHAKEVPINCQECGCSVPSMEALAFHIRVHVNDPMNQNNYGVHGTDQVDKEYLVCDQCGCSFNTHEALMMHKKLHSGDPNLLTDICTLATNIQCKNFPNLSALNANNRARQSNLNAHQKEKRFICEHCNKGFVARHSLFQHKKKYPEGACTVRSFVCPTCNKAFHQRNHLILHERQHMDPNLRNPNRTHGPTYMPLDKLNLSLRMSGEHIRVPEPIPIKIETNVEMSTEDSNNLTTDSNLNNRE